MNYIYMNEYTDTFSYLNNMDQLIYDRNRYRQRQRHLNVRVPNIILTNIRPHLTSSDLRIGQRYLFVQNLNTSNPVQRFKAEFVDTVSNAKYGHMIKIKNVTRNSNGDPDENGIADNKVYYLATKSLNAYLIKKEKK
jgi:hypothetical protein